MKVFILKNSALKQYAVVVARHATHAQMAASFNADSHEVIDPNDLKEGVVLNIDVDDWVEDAKREGYEDGFADGQAS